MRSMRKDLEAEEKWLGQEEKKALIRTRSFMDKMSALIDLCIYQENRVLNEVDPGKDDHNKSESDEFEVLNLSELEDEWDAEDVQIINQTEVVDEQN